MGKGRRWENEVANAIHDESGGSLLAWTAGYSGNSAAPAPDVFVIGDGGAEGYELKRTSQDSLYVPAEELSQLSRLERTWFDTWLVVKFTHRSPVFIRPMFTAEGMFGLDGGATGIDAAEAFAARVPEPFVPDGGCVVTSDESVSLRLDRPESGTWKSARSGMSAAEKIVALHGVGSFDSVRPGTERVRDLGDITHPPDSPTA